MKLRRMTISALLVALLAAGCEKAGDFCDVVSGPYAFEASTAAAMVRTDRTEVVRLDAQNAYHRRHCR